MGKGLWRDLYTSPENEPSNNMLTRIYHLGMRSNSIMLSDVAKAICAAQRTGDWPSWVQLARAYRRIFFFARFARTVLISARFARIVLLSASWLAVLMREPHSASAARKIPNAYLIVSYLLLHVSDCSDYTRQITTGDVETDSQPHQNYRFMRGQDMEQQVPSSAGGTCYLRIRSLPELQRMNFYLYSKL